MAEIELVIKIDEDTYKDIKKGKVYSSVRDVPQESVVAIANGTPLPKGHGRLIDAELLCDYFWDNRSKLYTHKDLQIVIDNAPTIIEAEIEGKE